MAEGDWEIIGTRPNSAFRVQARYFFEKPQFQAGVDTTTGGPCVVVYAGTDEEVPGTSIDRGTGRVIQE